MQAPGEMEAVFSRYIDPVYRFLYGRVGNREDAEDLASEVFLKASRQLDPARSEASIAQWLFTVARTVLADHWRHYYRSGSTLPLPENVSEQPQAVSEESEVLHDGQLVEQLLDSLPERYRRVLELRFLRGYSVQETATEMHITPQNVKVLQHRALAKAVQLGEEMR